MKYNFGEQFEVTKTIAEGIINENPVLKKELNSCELSLGLASESEFGVENWAPEHALFVGDSNLYGSLLNNTAEIESMFRNNPDKVNLMPKWNPKINKFDMAASKSQYTKDSDVLSPAQLISAWNVGWFQGIFKRPLSYSRFRDLVKTYTGTSPWCEVMNLLLADYSGFAALTSAGRPDNMLSHDVGVQAGYMTSSVINLSVTYSITREELERSKESQSENPFAGVLITQKQKYADYVMDILTSYLGFYGNDITGTIGLMSVNNAVAWSTYGATLRAIEADTGDTTKGSVAYRILAKALVDFLVNVDNKFNQVKIVMSPYAYNKLATLVYSDVYNPNSAMKIIKENLEADMTKEGRPLNIEIIAEPMLKASSMFNAQTYDYLMFIAPEIEAGATEEKQDIVLFGEPLKEFVYPVIPGSFHTAYRKLRRVAGIYCPVTAAVKVFYGYGQLSAST
jgi:hypothetical protein